VFIVASLLRLVSLAGATPGFLWEKLCGGRQVGDYVRAGASRGGCAWCT
jgi:hypothetical protein